MKKLFLIIAFLTLLSFPAMASDIHVYPTDSGSVQRSKVEGATAGDTVYFHPGTYDDAIFRITNSGASGNPITFRAYDPNDKPIFDMSRWEEINRSSDTYYAASTWGIGSWPGGNWGGGDGQPSHTGGVSWDRGVFVLWRVGYINIEDIEITKAYNYAGNCAGFLVNAEGGPVNIRRCKVTWTNLGFGQRCTYNAGTDLVTVSNCEFGWNGDYPNQPPPGAHPIYTSGGTVIFEYCYIHDAQSGQLFHIRNIEATFRYCWFENPYSFMGDMSDIRENTIEPDEQVLTFMGCVFVDGKGAEAPYTNNNIIVIQEGAQSNVPQRLNLYYNTFVGQSDYASDRYNLITFSGWSGHQAYLPSLYAYNNVFHNVYAPRLMRFWYTGTYRTRDLRNNWFTGSSGDYSLFSSWMSNNIFGGQNDPFNDRAGGDYTLASGSTAIGHANPELGSTPIYQYIPHLSYQPKIGVSDLGAFGSVGDDITPPRDVTNAHKIGFDGSNLEVGWTNPTTYDEYGELIPENQDFEGVMIRYNVGSDAPYPANHTEGTLFVDFKPAYLDGNNTYTKIIPAEIYKFSFFSHDADGHYSTTVHLLVDTKLPPVNVPPIINSFTGMPSSLNNPGETITLNAFATDPDGDSLTYTINFGDGTVSESGSEVVHTYASAGTYTAEVLVDDGHDHIVGKSLQIAVNDVPPAKPTGATVK